MLYQPQSDNRLPVPKYRQEMDVYEGYAPEPKGKPTTNLLVVGWHGRWIILGCVVIALMCGIAFVFHAAPVYSSSSVIYVQSAVPKVLSDQISSGGDSVDYLYTQSQLIQSTTLLAGAMDVPGVADADCLRGVDDPIGYIKRRVSAQPTRQGDFVVVSMEAPDPQSAATIVNGVVQAYIDYQTRVHQSTAVEIVRILQKNVDQHEAELKTAQNAMLELQRQNPDFNFQSSNESSAVPSRISAMSAELADTQERILDLKIALAAATAAAKSPAQLREILNEYHLGNETLSANGSSGDTLASEYDRERQSLDSLTVRFGPRNDAVVQQHGKVDRLKQEMVDQSQQEASSALSTIQGALLAARERYKQLQDAIANERQASVSMTSKDTEYQQLALEVQRANRELDSLDTRMKEINPTEEIGSLTVTVLESAKPVPVPVRPNRPQVMGMSLAGGLLVGLGLAMLREALDQRVRSAEEVVTMLKLPVLGAVPHIVKQAAAIRGQEAAFRPRSDIAEAFRTIRTAIYFGAYDSRILKTVLLTSPGVSDGKSTSTSNLAIAVSHAGRRVLLMDADCRRPSQHKIFDLDNSTGLSDVLGGQLPFEKAVRRNVKERLDVLPCGPLPSHPAELLDSKQFIDLLKSVSAEYDHVFIDSPPVIPVSDARVIAAFCDATVLVLRAQRSTRRNAEQACQLLDSVGAKLLGVIMNDTPRGGRIYRYQRADYSDYVEDSSTTTNEDARVRVRSRPVTVEPELLDKD